MIFIIILSVILSYIDKPNKSFSQIRIIELVNYNDKFKIPDFSEKPTPKQTPTPIIVIPTPSASPIYSKSDFFTSVGMYVFYAIVGIILILLVVSYVVYHFCKNDKLNWSKSNDQSIANEMNQPLAENLDLPDEGTVQI